MHSQDSLLVTLCSKVGPFLACRSASNFFVASVSCFDLIGLSSSVALCCFSSPPSRFDIYPPVIYNFLDIFSVLKLFL